MPDVFTPAHLRSLNFRFIKWNDLPGALVDFRDRIGAFYVGMPEQRLTWERGVIDAAESMQSARWHLDTARLDRDAVSFGIGYPERRFERPENTPKHGLNNAVVLASLRNCPGLQMITSFQNGQRSPAHCKSSWANLPLLAAYRTVAPLAWESARQIIDAVLENDPNLRMPLDLTNFGNPQPTAFSEVEYSFSTNLGTPRYERDYIPGCRALTTLGNYDDDGGLICWRDKMVIQMPSGSTILFPAGCMPYSFTAVDDTEWRMTVTQSLGHSLHQYRANAFAHDPILVTTMTEDDARDSLQDDAVAARCLYPTLAEYDMAWNKGPPEAPQLSD
ncbi:hypothetical protein C8R43DRAFT_1138104 [Mycena crocata]|nr:hypothetical protein C8R43DRAFT_1138104 [Mycena crocata]